MKAAAGLAREIQIASFVGQAVCAFGFQVAPVISWKALFRIRPANPGEYLLQLGGTASQRLWSLGTMRRIARQHAQAIGIGEIGALAVNELLELVEDSAGARFFGSR